MFEKYCVKCTKIPAATPFFVGECVGLQLHNSNCSYSLGIGERAGGSGEQSPPPKKIKKMSFFGQKTDAIWAKINHTNFLCT